MNIPQVDWQTIQAALHRILSKSRLADKNHKCGKAAAHQPSKWRGSE
jgi:hypothetical protein